MDVFIVSAHSDYYGITFAGCIDTSLNCPEIITCAGTYSDRGSLCQAAKKQHAHGHNFRLFSHSSSLF
jgi:hypothetical protein